MRILLFMVLLSSACLLGAQPKDAKLPPKAAAKETKPEKPEKVVTEKQEWCFETTAVATTGSSYTSLICLEETKLCEQVNTLYKKKGGLLGIEIIAKCKARSVPNAR